MSDSYSNGKYLESIEYKYKEICKDNKNKPHVWKCDTPFYGMSKCEKCGETMYTK